MKINKITLLLAGTLVAAAAALFTNCAKENATPVVAATEETAAERAVCQLKVQTTGALQVCGTQTNANGCFICQACTNALGVENVATGEHIYTLTDANMFRVTNIGLGAVTVRLVTATDLEIINLNPGASQAYSIDGNCDLTQI